MLDKPPIGPKPVPACPAEPAEMVRLAHVLLDTFALGQEVLVNPEASEMSANVRRLARGVIWHHSETAIAEIPASLHAEIERLRNVIATNAAIARSSVSVAAIAEEAERYRAALVRIHDEWVVPDGVKTICRLALASGKGTLYPSHRATHTASGSPVGIDPVCVFHGKKASEHNCLYCCLCFKDLTPDQCHVTANGEKEDVCNECAETETERGQYASVVCSRCGERTGVPERHEIYCRMKKDL